jgi:hypothetical protein
VKKKKGARGANYQKARKYVVFRVSKRVQKRCKRGAKGCKKGAKHDFLQNFAIFSSFLPFFKNHLKIKLFKKGAKRVQKLP